MRWLFDMWARLLITGSRWFPPIFMQFSGLASQTPWFFKLHLSCTQPVNSIRLVKGHRGKRLISCVMPHKSSATNGVDVVLECHSTHLQSRWMWISVHTYGDVMNTERIKINTPSRCLSNKVRKFWIGYVHVHKKIYKVSFIHSLYWVDVVSLVRSQARKWDQQILLWFMILVMHLFVVIFFCYVALDDVSILKVESYLNIQHFLRLHRNLPIIFWF